MDQIDAKSAGDAQNIPGLPRSSKDSHPVIQSFDFMSDKYKMDHTDRGTAVIINNKKFDAKTGMPERAGTDVDSSSMYDIFNMMKFEKIKVQNDITAREMEIFLKKVAKEDHSENDCFACVILSHGEEGFVYGTDEKISMDKLVAPFKGDKCTSLAGKPKIFFIQACRGTKLDQGVTESDAVGDMESDDVEERRIPTEADFLFAYSTVPGFFAWRNSKNGSWFIQAIAMVFKSHWKEMDLLTMMTRVNKKVAFDFESNASQEYLSRKKQIPCMTSMLTKDVFFN